MTQTEEIQATQQESDRVAAVVNQDPGNTLVSREDRNVEAFNLVLKQEADSRGDATPKRVGGKKAEKPAPASAPQPTATSEAAPVVEETKSTKETAAQGVGGDAAYEHAVKALQLDGYRPDDLAALGRNRVIALGESASKRQASYSQKLDELSRQVPKGEAAKPQETEQPAPKAPERQPLDLKAAVKPLVDMFGEEAEPALQKYAEAITGSLADENRALSAKLEQLGGLVVSMQAMQMRGKLPEDVRRLTDEADFEAKVVPRALQLFGDGRTSGYTDFVDALRDATLAVGGTRLLAEAAEFRARKSDLRENGQLHSVESKTPPKAKSWDDRAFAAFKVIEAGGGAEEARAAFGT